MRLSPRAKKAIAAREVKKSYKEKAAAKSAGVRAKKAAAKASKKKA
jgi:hypothetical protein